MRDPPYPTVRRAGPEVVRGQQPLELLLQLGLVQTKLVRRHLDSPSAVPGTCHLPAGLNGCKRIDLRKRKISKNSVSG